jgi:hypothetical protein
MISRRALLAGSAALLAAPRASAQARASARTPDGYVRGSFQIDPVGGADANNGIPVGETGSGGTLSGVAGTGPFRTMAHVLELCERGYFTKPTRIYPRATGVHYVARYRFLNGGGRNDAVTAEKVEFLNYPGEEWTLDTATANPLFERNSGYGPIVFRTPNWRFSGALLRGALVFQFGGHGSGGDCRGAHIYRCRQTERHRQFIDNHGVCTGELTSCRDLLIEECDFLGSNNDNANISCLHFDRPGPNCRVVNCRLQHHGENGGVLHHKYNSIRLADEMLYENCLLHHSNGGTTLKESDGNSFLTFRNCIWWRTNAWVHIATTGVTGNASEGPLSYSNWFFNNGFYRSSPAGGDIVWFEKNRGGTMDGERNAWFRNELMGRIRVETPQGRSFNENWVGDENVFSASSGTHLRGGSSTRLKRWQELQAAQGSGNDDMRSVAARIVFADERGRDIDDPRSFRRAPSSPLFGVAGPDVDTWRRWAGAGEGPW